MSKPTAGELDVVRSGTEAARRLEGEITIGNRIMDCMRANAMSAMQIEGSDGVLMGGVIVVRGEREFAIVRMHLREVSQGGVK